MNLNVAQLSDISIDTGFDDLNLLFKGHNIRIVKVVFFCAQFAPMKMISSGQEQKRLLLLDARNLYETRIGMFQSSDVETLNPEIRQYSDLPAWMDKSTELLRDNHVLM